MIFVLEEVMHPQPKIFQAKLAKILPCDGKRIEVVLFEISAKLAPPLLVFPHRNPRPRKSNDTMIDATTLIVSSLCKALIIFPTSRLQLYPAACDRSSLATRRSLEEGS